MAGGATAASASRVLGANDRIRLGAIGTGGRGRAVMEHANRAGKTEWVALCDAWDERLRQGKAVTGGKGETYSDYRALLDRKDIDGVIVAPPDHWHSRMTVDACLAGKDVYVEKPMTSLPMQGHEVVAAQRRTGRVVQVGVQQRSMPHFIEAKERFFDSGAIGHVGMVRTVWNGNIGYNTPVPPGMDKKPAGLDWDAVLGWLPKIPWDPKRYFNRFAYWDFSSGGQTGGLFVHMVDVVHWFLGLKNPLSAVAIGGIYEFDDGRDTPDNINLILEYPGRVNVSFEASLSTYANRFVTSQQGSRQDVFEQFADVLRDPEVRKSSMEADIVFLGTGGRLSIFRHGYEFAPSPKDGRPAKVAASAKTADYLSDTWHMENWLDCIRSRRTPNADVVAGHYSSMACHIGNMAYKEGRKMLWNNAWDV